SGQTLGAEESAMRQWSGQLGRANANTAGPASAGGRIAMRETGSPSITRPRARHDSAQESVPRAVAPRMAAALPLAGPARTPRVGRLEALPVTFVTRTIPEPEAPHVPHTDVYPGLPISSALGSATAGSGVYQTHPRSAAFPVARPAPSVDPDVWLIALP